MTAQVALPWDQVSLPWDAADALCPLVAEKEQDSRYREHNTCRFPGCGAWIRDGAKTCRKHRSWYEMRIGGPVERLIPLLREARRRGMDLCPAIVLGADGLGEIAPELKELL